MSVKTKKELLASINKDDTVLDTVLLWGSLITLVGGWIILQTYITGV